MKTILVVEDEIAIAQVLRVYLRKANLEAITVNDGHEALKKFHEINPALVLLDVMLPGQDGWTILKKIRAKSTCPVIMLTALDEVNYRLSGLNGGADDYITKPFIADEVIARIHAVLRRTPPLQQQQQQPKNHDILTFGKLKIDVNAHKVELGDMEITLTPRVLTLLIYLAQHPNRTFTREQLIERVWGIDYEGSDRAVDIAITRIRIALEGWPPSEGEIKTLRGLGYQFCSNEKN